MKEFYVIVRENWEYDDNYYYQPEGEGYNILEDKLWDNLEEAQKECDRLNKQHEGQVYRYANTDEFEDGCEPVN